MGSYNLSAALHMINFSILKYIKHNVQSHGSNYTTPYSTQGKCEWRKQVYSYKFTTDQCAWSAHTHSACMHIILQLETYYPWKMAITRLNLEADSTR